MRRLRAFPAAALAVTVIAIAATNLKQHTANFSSAGTYVDFAAPGVGIWTSVPGGAKILSGTSIVSPGSQAPQSDIAVSEVPTAFVRSSGATQSIPAPLDATVLPVGDRAHAAASLSSEYDNE